MDCSIPGNTKINEKSKISACRSCASKVFGRRQSPIDVDIKKLVVKRLPALEFSVEYAEVPAKMFSDCSNRYDVYAFQYRSNRSPVISGGPLSKPYIFERMHIHEGIYCDSGSEHAINGKKFPMELHAVHLIEGITSDEASNYSNAYAILAYFFEESQDDNPAITKLLDHFIHQKVPFPLSDLVKPFSESYMTYLGSLTTKSFTENATWILSPYVSKISRRQLDELRRINCVRDCREVQELNGRIVYVAERNDNLLKILA